MDEDGVKRISEEALKLYNNVKPCEAITETTQDAPQTRENGESAKDEYLTAKTIKSLQETVEALRDVVNRQAEELNQKTEMLDERDRQIADYASKFAELAHNALQTAVQAQTLHAVSESDKLVKSSQSELQGVVANENVAARENESDLAIEQNGKHGLKWLSKLFSKH